MPERDLHVRAIAWNGVAIAVTIALAVGAVLLLLRAWQAAPGADRVRLPYDLVVAAPTLQSAPQPELARERERKARILATSGWVDGARGIVRIPIATAMRLLAAKNADAAAAAASAAPAPPAAAAPSTVAAPSVVMAPASAAGARP